MQFLRKKSRSYLVIFMHQFFFGPLGRLISDKKKLRFFLYISWVFERLSYNASYRYYKTFDHPGRKLTRDFILPHISSNFTILDLGCGYGHYSNMLAQKAKQVVGVDYDAGLIGMAKKTYNAPNLTFLHDDAYSYLKKNDKKFDVLILTHVLEHLDNPGQFLNQFKEFFSYIFVEVPDFNKDILNKIREELKTPFAYSDEDHMNEFERHQIKKVIENCGLVIEHAQYMAGIQYLWIKC